MQREIERMESYYMMPGFRFYPTEEELVSFYLQKKIQQAGTRRGDLHQVIPELYIYEFNPWDLPQFAGEHCPKDPEQWFFFVPRHEKEVRGGRPNRLTTSGFWKATGSPGHVFSSDNRIIGAKRTMVFYKGRAPTGVKTEWKMNEYTAIDGESASSSLTATLKLREEFSLCRVYKRSKCLRAFDRRPSSSSTIAMISAAAINQAQDHHNIDRDCVATTYPNHPQNDHPTMETIITNSSILSSSKDHANPISQPFNPARDDFNTNWAATTYQDHHKNDHQIMERIITTSPNQTSTGDIYAILNSQTFNEGHDHNTDHAWAATAYHEHQNNYTVMESMITASLDQSSSWHHQNLNGQTLASVHGHPNCDMGFDNNEYLGDFWGQLNFF